MRVEIRSDSVVLDGYVNTVLRQSNPVITPRGKVIEVIEQRTFEKALERAENVELLLNHDENRQLGSTREGNLQLWEDAIGLRAVCTVKDPEVMEKAREGKLKGWSFGMYTNEDYMEERGEELPIRHITDLDLLEVSIIDNRMKPCYSATSIETRAGEEATVERRTNELRAVVENMSETTVDYSAYEERIQKLKSSK